MKNENILNILILRDTYTPTTTLGKCYINGQFFSYTLEDEVRGEGIKIAKHTAIPQGVYDVGLSYSPRFKRKMPIVYKVPHFTGIRMHGGNTAAHTSGCIILAHNKINNDTVQGTAEKEMTKILKNNDAIKKKLVIINQRSK